MAGRRFLYLTVLTSCLVLCYAYRQWLCLLLLAVVFFLPVFSLLLSIPAMVRVRVRLNLPKQVTQNTRVTPVLDLSCPLPAPPVRCKLRVHHSITGETLTYTVDAVLPTEHSAALQIRPVRIWAYDYLGLFRRRLRQEESTTLYVLPEPVAPKWLPETLQRPSYTEVPKPGGGFSENYDLRQYRPGDNLRQIHWKLAAKTGTLIYKEPLAPQPDTPILSLILPNTEPAIDDVLGKLLWISRRYLAAQQPHQVRCLTGNGRADYTICDEAELMQVLYALLLSPAAPLEARLPENAVYRIGGDRDA